MLVYLLINEMIESGTTLQGRFLIEERIGEGGMGAVYRAIDQKFGSQVAIKETFYGDPELAEAFEREARLLNSLHHPIFPHVSDHFTENGGHFLVMEYIEGDDMSELLKRGIIFAVEDVMRWTLDLLDGLDYLHSQDPPIIHRDIKPNNLKLTSRGNVMLLDFGMAKETSGNTLGMRSVFGYSRRYSPLEQIEGTGTDARSDIFSLGATVFHLLTGKPPVDVLARASAIVSGRPDPLLPADALRRDVPELVSAMIHSALALNPEQRFISARAMWNALEASLDQNREEAAEEVPAHDRVSIVSPVIVNSDGEFPALEAFKAERDEEQPEAAPAGGAAVAAVDQVDATDKSLPLARAVIHLDSADEQDELFDAPVVAEPYNPAPLGSNKAAAPTPIASWLGPEFRRRSVWLPLLILSAVLGTLVIYGLVSGSQENADGEPTSVAPASEVPDQEPVAETSVETTQTAPPAAGTSDAKSDEVASNTDPNSADNVLVDPDTTADGRREPIRRSEANRPRPDDAQVPAERATKSDSAEEREVRARRSGASQSRRQRSVAVRPRIVDEFGDPEVARIETIFTGIPYERRPRWRDRWVDDEE